MRVLGLDIGSKTIGVAVTDPLGISAQGVGVIRRQGGQHDLDRVAEYAARFEVERIVYGLPTHLDGRESQSSRRARTFAEKLEAHLRLPVEPYDEAFTTREAEAVLIAGGVSRKRRKALVDKVAAQRILQGWLDARAATERRTP
ncbi:MAG: Holliday junction resolvase RuvX [Deltaproteobacteria bacterium]|nr:MAG: Holliday junction resolvase RuvX [Deltaproteobacteria bacterium]